MTSIEPRFIPIHLPDRNQPNELSLYCKRNKEPPVRRSLSQSVIGLLLLGVPHVAPHDEGLMKENIFGLLRRDVLPFPVLVCVGLIPVKSGARLQVIEGRHCIWPYTGSSQAWRPGANRWSAQARFASSIENGPGVQ